MKEETLTLDLLGLEKFGEKHGIKLPITKKSPYSIDLSVWGKSTECGILEDPWAEPEEDMWLWTKSPENAPDEPTYINLTFRNGDIVAISIGDKIMQS